MGYSKEIIQIAAEKLSERRYHTTMEQENRRSALLQKIPALFQIEQALAQTGLKLSRAILYSRDIDLDLHKIKAENLELQLEYNTLLKNHGFPADYLDRHPYCALCNDEGYVDGKPCTCFNELMKQEAFARLNQLTPLALSDFDSFRLHYYTDDILPIGTSSQKRMTSIFEYCREYANDFSVKSKSLLFQGSTGLGKTHLSLAIARTAIVKGYGVVYGSVQNLMNRLEKERFNHNFNDNHDSSQTLLDCDLLILDDLGTEFITQFVVSCMYNIINARILSGKPTIISTNLSMNELNQKYSERFTSRIMGNYTRLVFLGDDVRQIKNK